MNGWLRHGRVVLLALVLLPAFAGAQAEAATLYDLGDLIPNGLNGKDQVVGDIADLNGDADDDHPGFWQTTATQPNGVLTPLQRTGGDGGATAINDSGAISGRLQAPYVDGAGSTDLQQHAVKWASSTATPVQAGPVQTSTNGVATFDMSFGNDIDNAGELVGQTFWGNPYYTAAFLGTGSALTNVGRADQPLTTSGNQQFSAASTEASAITPDGTTILGSVGSHGNQTQPTWYLWGRGTGSGTPLGLTPPRNGAGSFGGDTTGARVQNDLASDGTVLGYTGGPDDPHVFYTRSPIGTLTAVPGLAGYNGINAKHAIVGTVGTSIETIRAALRKPDGTVVDLNTLLPAGGKTVLYDALTINDDGDIAGIAYDDTHEFGFLLKAGYVVDSTGDQPDKDTTDGECLTTLNTCTLRAAIQQANADGSTAKSSISFDVTNGVPAGALPKITPATALPKITVPVEIDGTTQPSPLVAGSRRIGVIIDGGGATANAFDLASTATGSLVHGVQIQNVKGDAVKLGASNSQLAGSVLVKDQIGAEVAANGAVVGAGNGLPGNVFFEDGNGEGLATYLKGLAPHSGEAGFAAAVASYGAGVLLSGASSGAQIKGNLVGVHGAGFGAAPDQLDADGFSSKNLPTAAGILSFGVLIDPVGSTVSNVTVGGSGPDANTISGTGFGVAAISGAGGSVSGLSVIGNQFGPAADGAALDPFGGIFGFLAAGSISGLQLGTTTTGNTFSGELFAASIAGQQVASPQIQGNVFGTTEEEPLPTITSDGLGTHDLAGLVLSDAVGAQVQGNKLVGDYIGLVLAGDHLSGDTVSGNTIGAANPKTFGSFANVDFTQFRSLFGVIYSGNAAPGTNAPAQHVTFDHNAIQGNVIGLLANAGTGATYSANTFSSDAIALLDGGSGGSKIGAAGAGNTFADDGFGLFMANQDPTPDDAKHADVNPALTSQGTKDSAFTQVDEDLATTTINAITSADLGTGSTVTSTVPGTGNSVLGNVFGTDTNGATKQVSLPLTVAGDEHGVKIGGLGAGEGNTITHSRAGGVWLIGAGSHQPTAQILGNTIYDNENFTETNLTGVPGLGIDLIAASQGSGSDSIGGFGFGINPQDATQPDVGPNGDQNAPVITQATTASGQLTVAGTLHGVPSTAYVLEVYADDNQNPFGAGEGQRLLGRPTVTTDGNGNASFADTYPAPGSARFVSATATTVPGGGAAGVTSEFAVNLQITDGIPPVQGGTAPAPGGAPGSTVPAGAATTGVTPGATGTSVKTSGTGTITIPAIVTCSNATTGSCTVTTAAKVVTPSKAKGSRVAVAARAAGKKASKKTPKVTYTTVGKGTASLAAGATGKVGFTLNAAGKNLLKSEKKLAVTVTVTVGGAGRKAVDKTFTVNLAYVAPKKAKAPTKKHK